ncbi:MAG: nucleotide sugar dehydrogenase, partial [Candidatus Gastranaerophilales bacterium]|nr:nucleotide sugar dehydrogenase [Candidatus Gastranaerophilales bacterium]
PILNKGNIHIEEPELEALVKKVVNSGKLKAYATVQEADVYIIAVPTPVGEDKKACMDYVEAAVNSTLNLLKAGDLIILESTSPPGTTKDLVVPILKKTNLKIGEELFVAYCPEKVLPGQIIRELVENKRIIGGINEKSAQMAKEVYKSFVKGEIFLTDSTTAEMVKVMENTYRDVNIALANELAKISYKMGIDAWEVINLANMHPRVNLHCPGPGVGGHCISVDPWFIVEKNPDLAVLIREAREINNSMPEFTYNLVLEQVRNIPSPKITVLGITYKPDIDDIRESPAVEIVNMLESNPRLRVSICDPHVKGFNNKLVSLEEALQDSDCILLAVNHKEFGSIDPADVARLVNSKIIIDTRNVLNKTAWEENGFKYVLLGEGKEKVYKVIR